MDVGMNGKTFMPQQRSAVNRSTYLYNKLALQIAREEVLIVNRGIPNILRTATLIVGCLFQRIKQDVGELRRQKPLPREFSALTASTQLRLIAFLVSFLVECPQGNAASTIITMEPLCGGL